MPISRRQFIQIGAQVGAIAAASRFVVADVLAQASSADQSMYAQLDRFVEQYMRDMAAPGMTLVLADRSGVQRIATYGFGDLNHRAPLGRMRCSKSDRSASPSSPCACCNCATKASSTCTGRSLNTCLACELSPRSRRLLLITCCRTHRDCRAASRFSFRIRKHGTSRRTRQARTSTTATPHSRRSATCCGRSMRAPSMRRSASAFSSLWEWRIASQSSRSISASAK